MLPTVNPLLDEDVLATPNTFFALIYSLSLWFAFFADAMSSPPYLTPPPTLPPTRAPSLFRSPAKSVLRPPLIARNKSAFHIAAQSTVIRERMSTVRSSDDANYQGERSPNSRGVKRRRLATSTRTKEILPSPSKAKHQNGSSFSPTDSHNQHNPPLGPPSRHRPSTLAPIKPIGFAASRENRREDGTDHAIPSPVVMGVDFKQIDEEQLKTVGLLDTGLPKVQAEQARVQVRDTLSIKEQQQALIAQRRREVTASTPNTPKELTFKGWTPKDPERLGVGRRREKTKDKVESMSIVTSTSDKEVVLGSKVGERVFFLHVGS